MSSFGSGKRSRDEYEEDNNAGGGFGGGHGGYEEAKRQQVDPQVELIANVCKDIRRIGENSNIVTQVDDISYISNPIVAEFEKIDKLRVSILNTLYSVVIEQPQKITSLSVLILLCNPKNFLVAKYVIEFFHSKAQGLVDRLLAKDAEAEAEQSESHVSKIQKQQDLQEFAGIFNNLKSIIKFLACLSPIVENYAIADIFKQFLNLAIELQSNTETGKRNGLAEEIFYNTLISLPYLLSNDWSDEMKFKCDELVELAGKFDTKGQEEQSFSLLEPFYAKGSNFAENIPYKPKNIISLIYPAILEIQKNGWNDFKDKLFINFDELIQPIIAKSLENNQLSNELVKHQLPPLSLPSVDKILESKGEPLGIIDSLWYKSPRILFQVYNITTDFETVPPIESYIGLFFKDLSFDILTNLSFNKKEASIQLSILDLYFSKNLFAPPGSSVDQLTRVHEDNEKGENVPPLSTWKIEDIAIESILTMIFQLPLPLHVEVYYYSVLILCCRESPESIAPVFGRAIRFFYNNLECLDYELKIRFLDWMTIQISNFEFSWKWDEWVKDSKQFKNLKYHPKRNFIKNLIAKEIRLSNKNKIRDTFVTIDPENNNSLVKLDEFYKYLSLSLVENEEKFILDYDISLYGGDEKVKEIFEELAKQRQEKKELHAQGSSLIVSPQDELIYNFSLPTVPLNEIANTVYDFVVANWKSNSDFQDLCNSVLLAVDKRNEENSDFPINREKYLVNLIVQTYVYIGSRSIYSAVSVFSRDIVKLRYLTGWKLEDDATSDEKNGAGFTFEPLNLTEEQFNERQEWTIESIFRVWNHQPQVAFLILEYLIKFKIVKPIKLIEKVLSIDSNLIIENVSCMESINRVLGTLSSKSKDEQVEKVAAKSVEKKEDKDDMDVEKEDKSKENGDSEAKEAVAVTEEDEEPVEQTQESSENENEGVLRKLFELIVTNINTISRDRLDIPVDGEVLIDKKDGFSEEEVEDLELMGKIDNQWLFYEYLGLLKSYIRRYNANGAHDEIFSTIENNNVKTAVQGWINEIRNLKNE